MKTQRFLSQALVIAGVWAGVFWAAPARAASVQMVADGTWGGSSGVPSYVTMYIYVPDQLAERPPILVACHSCGTPVSGYVNSITQVRAAADENGFIIILPEATGRNCWDVGTMQSLSHDGGGDTEAIARMVDYALGQYDGDPSRVYVMGGSSGAMMTQALIAVYPDIFRAGSARAGVAAGCWADGFDMGQQWSNNCAGGRTTKSAQQWGDQARGMFPGYTGHRPRLQLFHGTNDTTIAYANMAESIKQWTNVMELPTMPARTGMVQTSVSTYDQQFWENECGYTVFETWAGRNGTHSMAYEEAAILAFFGLDEEGGPDPEPECPAAGGAGGMGGMTGMAGGAGAPQGGLGGMPVAGGGGAPTAGMSGSGTSGASGSIGQGGAQMTAGGTAGTPSGGAPPGGTGGAPTGGTGGTGTGGMNSAGMPAGGNPGSGGGVPKGGALPFGAGGGGTTPEEEEASGCGCAVPGGGSTHGALAVLALGALSLVARRRRRA